MGFLDKTFDKLFGRGDAWKEKGWAAAGDTREWAGHHAVIDHAKKLGYPGFIAPAGSDKGTWTRFTNAFNAWKATKPWEKKDTGGGGDVGYSGDGSGGTLGGGNFDTSGNPIGPYPFANVFFPQLVQAYERPEAENWGPPLSGPLGDPLLYQPWTSDYRSKYGGIMEYEPPKLNTGLPTFGGNPYGSLRLPDDWEDLLTLAEDDDDSQKKNEVNQEK